MSDSSEYQSASECAAQQQQEKKNITSDVFLQLPPGAEDLVHVRVDQHLLLPHRRPTFLLQRRQSLQQVLLDQDVRRLHRLRISQM